jgi:hypothetical protein
MVVEPGSSVSLLEHQEDCKASMVVEADNTKMRKGASTLLISLGQTSLPAGTTKQSCGIEENF